MLRAAAIAALMAVATAQQVGTDMAETHPKMSWSKCSSGGSCSTVQGEVVLDSNWRWLHTVGGYDNCYEGSEWTSKCSSPEDCASKCALEGADYAKTVSISEHLVSGSCC
jgi:cellulose 1,4-beta-cellobiosidase